MRKKTASPATAVPPPPPPPADSVEAALLKRALGFDHEEVYQEALHDKSSGEPLETVKVKRVRKTVPPDVRALLFWLKNRSPDRWRERVEPEPESPQYDFESDEMNL